MTFVWKLDCVDDLCQFVFASLTVCANNLLPDKNSMQFPSVVLRPSALTPKAQNMGKGLPKSESGSSSEVPSSNSRSY